MEYPQSNSFSIRIHLIFATIGGVGYLPFAPGTWGSLVGAATFWFIAPVSLWILVPLVVILFFTGTWSSTVIEKITDSVDPGLIIVDEFVAMWIVLMTIPQTFVHYLFAFVLFRIFDVMKPPPASQLQLVSNGWGVMLDDVAAGLYSIIIMQIGMMLF